MSARRRRRRLAAALGLLAGVGLVALLGARPAVGTTVHVVGFWTDPATAAGPGGGWLVNSDGDVMPEGGAPYHGDLDGRGVSDITGMLATLDGGGYWLVGADGGVFTFGNAHYHGSLPGSGITPSTPVAGIDWCNAGQGYVVITQQGAAYPFNC
jgi:hypothetical protein